MKASNSWVSQTEPPAGTIAISAAVIMLMQNNNLDCHQTAGNQTFDLSFQRSDGGIDLEADGCLCDISQFGHELDCPEKKQAKHVHAQPHHWLQLLQIYR